MSQKSWDVMFLGEKRLWQAWTIADLESNDGLDLTLAMIPVMVGSLGRTVKKQPFTLP